MNHLPCDLGRILGLQNSWTLFLGEKSSEGKTSVNCLTRVVSQKTHGPSRKNSGRREHMFWFVSSSEFPKSLVQYLTGVHTTQSPNSSNSPGSRNPKGNSSTPTPVFQVPFLSFNESHSHQNISPGPWKFNTEPQKIPNWKGQISPFVGFNRRLVFHGPP